MPSSTMTPVHLPQEIHDEIIQHLHYDPPTLRSTALTSHSLLVTSQKLLFAYIALYPPSSPSKKATVWRLLQLLEKSPHLGRYVDRLDLHIYADRCPWKGWNPLEFCLPLLTKLSVLGIRVDQTQAWTNNFMMRPPPVKPEDTQRVTDALINILRSPSLVYLDTHCLDTSLLLSHCRHIKELKLSSPINPDEFNISGQEDEPEGVVVNAETIFLEGLRLESPFDLRGYNRNVLRRALHAQNISFGNLKRLSMMYNGYYREEYLMELRGILRECSETIEELEIDLSLTTDDINMIIQHKSLPLPALRTFHFHLYALDTLNPEDAQTFVNTLNVLFQQLPAPVSAHSPLQRLTLVDHNTLTNHLRSAEWQSLLLDTLGSRVRFPALRSLSWQGSDEVVSHLKDGIFAKIGAMLPYDVQLGSNFNSTHAMVPSTPKWEPREA